MRNSWRSGWLASGVLVLLPLFGTGCTGEGVAQPATDGAVQEERIVPVRTVTVTTREVVDTSRLPADLLPQRRAVLAAEVAGTVEAVHVDEGARVTAGNVLLEVDTRSLKQGVAEAEAMYRNREIRLERARKLLERRSITDQQFLDATTEHDVSLAQLESARLAFEKSRVTAPWGGTVAVRRVEVGDYVVPGQPVIELLDTRRLKVRAPAPASDVPFLRPGLPAEVTVDTLPGEVFEGRIVRLAAELDAAARTLDVEVEIPNGRGRLRPGMVARLVIPRQTWPDAVTVPLAAVVELESQRVVYVVDASGEPRARRRVVSLGPSLGDEVVVHEGLTAGEQVIVEGQRRVSPDQRVDPEAAAG